MQVRKDVGPLVLVTLGTAVERKPGGVSALRLNTA
ncbi:UNVERIFIED_ORG: hypothetical protein CLV66_12468 [Actinomadura viridilutea]